MRRRGKYEHLMSHDAPRKGRRKSSWPLRLTPPRCDDCRAILHPDIDHSDCRIAS